MYDDPLALLWKEIWLAEHFNLIRVYQNRCYSNWEGCCPLAKWRRSYKGNQTITHTILNLTDNLWFGNDLIVTLQLGLVLSGGLSKHLSEGNTLLLGSGCFVGSCWFHFFRLDLIRWKLWLIVIVLLPIDWCIVYPLKLKTWWRPGGLDLQ
jgi:hypothetical protein